jgi:hypothetical protein
MTRHDFRRLLPLLCLGSMFAPAEALAGPIKRNSEWLGSAHRYGSAYVGQPAPPYYYYPSDRGRRQDLHLYLNAPGNTVRILDGGKQIVVYDRECRVYHEVVPSRRGPHPITVTRC